eukprot:577171-Alexandrium_andersonii.AAC.1
MWSTDLIEALVAVGAHGHQVGASQLGSLHLGTEKPGRGLRREASSYADHIRKDPLADPVLNRLEAYRGPKTIKYAGH